MVSISWIIYVLNARNVLALLTKPYYSFLLKFNYRLALLPADSFVTLPVVTLTLSWASPSCERRLLLSVGCRLACHAGYSRVWWIDAGFARVWHPTSCTKAAFRHREGSLRGSSSPALPTFTILIRVTLRGAVDAYAWQDLT